MNERFATLRGLLNQTPSSQSQVALHKLFASWPEDDTLSMALEYTAQHLSAAPHQLPLAPIMRLGPDERYLLLAPLPRESLAWASLQEFCTDFLAWDEVAQEQRIVRIFPTLHTASHARTELESQLQRAIRLAHPNVLPICDVDLQGKPCFIAMEHVFGPNLRQWMPKLRKEGTDEEREVLPLAIAMQLLDAVDAAHRHTDEHGLTQPFLHMRIIPESIVVSESGHCQLANFGMEHTLTSLSSSHATPMAPMGYYAPEQLAYEGVTNPCVQTDLFHVGVLLYELLTFQHPFQGKTELHALRRLYEGQSIPLQQVAPGLPNALVSLIDRAIAHDPEERYPDAASMKADLKVLYDATATQATTEAITSFLQRVFSIEALLTQYAGLLAFAQSAPLPYYWKLAPGFSTPHDSPSDHAYRPPTPRMNLMGNTQRSSRGQSIGVSSILSGVWRMLRRQS